MEQFFISLVGFKVPTHAPGIHGKTMLSDINAYSNSGLEALVSNQTYYHDS